MNKLFCLENKIYRFPGSYELYSADLFRYSYSILKSREEAEDAVQEVFVKYAENESSFKGDCSYKTWLLVIARNYCFNRIKNKNFNNAVINDDGYNGTFNPDYDMNISLKGCYKSTGKIP